MMSKRRIVMLIACSLWLWVEVPFSDATELVREEPIPIGSIIADPQAFHLRSVRLQGTIQTLERFPRTGGCGRYDGYHFVLSDQTGQLTISDFGGCHGNSSVKPPMTDFTIGDTIEVIITISVLPSPNFASHSLEGTLRRVQRIPELAGDGSHLNR